MHEPTQMELKEISTCSLKLMNTHKCMNRSVTGGEIHSHTEPFSTPQQLSLQLADFCIFQNLFQNYYDVTMGTFITNDDMAFLLIT